MPLPSMGAQAHGGPGVSARKRAQYLRESMKIDVDDINRVTEEPPSMRGSVMAGRVLVRMAWL